MGPAHPLIGRGELMAALEALLQSGQSRFVLLSGPPGIGSSTLAEHLAARHDGPVLRATAAEWESDQPHSLLAQLFPDLPTSTPLLTAAELAGKLTPRTLLVVHDAQFGDLDSLRALASTQRHHPRTALQVVATCATGDRRAAAEVLDLLPRIATDAPSIPPLDAAQVSELAAVHGIALHPSMAERLRRHTLGRPRPVVQLLTELPRGTWAQFEPALPAPAVVQARVRESLAASTARARRFAEATAVLGTDAPVHKVMSLAGLDAEPLPLMDETTAAGLVELAPRGLTYVSPPEPMVRAAVLTELGPARRAELQRRAAALVDDPVRSLRLLVAASPVPDAEVAGRLDDLARERAAEGAWGTAATLLSDASRLTDDPLHQQALITRAVDALIGAGDVFRATALVPEVESIRETPLRDAVLGYLAMVRGRSAEAGNRLRRAWSIVNTDREPETAALICQRHVLDALCRYDGRDLVLWADRAVELAGADSPTAVEAAAIRGIGLAATGSVKQAQRHYEHLIASLRHGAQWQRATMARGWINLISDRIDDARVDFESAIPTAYLGGSARISLWARAWLARVQFLTGEWNEALATVREAVEMQERTGILVTGPLLRWTEAAVHALRGDFDEAEDVLLRSATGAGDYQIMRVPSLLARAHLAEARADSDGVLRALYPLTRPSPSASTDEPGHWPWQDVYAHALVLLGRLDEADAFLDPHEKLAAKRGHTSMRSRLAAARGRLHGASGDVDAASASFDEALELIGALPLRYDQARINFSYGQTLRRLRRRARADVVLSAARDGFAAMGARTYVERCDRELKAGGVHRVRPEPKPNALTPQEESVVRLVARGLSNKEVAAELYLSSKTVQYHLTRIYAKLGIRSRSELAARSSPVQDG
ncbi:LuxR C-terminal-related transcriptional regulator [Saccharopolyspora mangrovi]|uniref:LuxR C-terminal-related transcriptional regulator n=1 Tax=Saccharopolyspora mangrovi TaxID=3082379 RepID=A0ABU6AEV9_9PSEU|nr:LuxR C-terminal-related transcriptional regulator [Saccharopolyspora sp. S2-29]MEB3369855.1 LuxR C-terminal-related transcriptional regulator [Saccharopolyspora sp. S2-29]